jgi:hypothetical protein
MRASPVLNCQSICTLTAFREISQVDTSADKVSLSEMRRADDDPGYARKEAHEGGLGLLETAEGGGAGGFGALQIFLDCAVGDLATAPNGPVR